MLVVPPKKALTSCDSEATRVLEYNPIKGKSSTRLNSDGKTEVMHTHFLSVTVLQAGSRNVAVASSP
jgi:hypothetical protein